MTDKQAKIAFLKSRLHFTLLQEMTRVRGWQVVKRQPDEDFFDEAPYILIDEQGVWSAPGRSEMLNLSEVVETLDQVEPLEPWELEVLNE